MRHYLVKFSYTPETWARLIENPEDRRGAAREYLKAVGGTLQGFWYAFGEYDAYLIAEVPDDTAMATVALAISAGGALSSFHTTPLLDVADAVTAMRQAGKIQYRAPGA